MTPYNIEKILEGDKVLAYDCSRGYRTVGRGFNMDNPKAREIWAKLGIEEDFDKVYNKKQKLSEVSSKKLFDHIWSWCVKAAKRRCADPDINLDFDNLRAFHQFLICDVAYNTGSLRSWKKIFLKTAPMDIIFEARRKPKKMMDSRVAKIAYQYGWIESVEDAKQLGLKYTKYIK